MNSKTPFTPWHLIAYLNRNKIVHQTAAHEPVFTVEESQALRRSLPGGSPGGPGGGHVKNLYLKNKKGRMWLVTMDEAKRLDIKTLSEKLESPRLSFGSADKLMENLGVLPGSVTPFALINDPGHKVTFLLDAGLVQHDRLHFHPLTNTMTTMLSPKALAEFLRLQGRDLRLIAL